jgi:hypothetical protein
MLLKPLRIELCVKWQQDIRYASEAPISKHQIPNNVQIPISNDRKGSVWKFGHWVIGNYLEFGIWILGFSSQEGIWFRLRRVK